MIRELCRLRYSQKFLVRFEFKVSNKALAESTFPDHKYDSAFFQRFKYPPTLYRFSRKLYQSKISHRFSGSDNSQINLHTPGCPSPKQNNFFPLG